MKNLTSPTDPQTNPLPEEVQALVAALLEGRVHSLAIVADFEQRMCHEAPRNMPLEQRANEDA